MSNKYKFRVRWNYCTAARKLYGVEIVTVEKSSHHLAARAVRRQVTERFCLSSTAVVEIGKIVSIN